MTIPVTAYDVDADPLYALDDSALAPVFEKRVGAGRLIFVGIAPRYFASSSDGGNHLRSIVAYACEKAGVEYREQGHLTIRRGRYVAVRSLDSAVRLDGEFIDVLDPRLNLLSDPIVPAGGLALVADAGDLLVDTVPRLLLSSDRVEASRETSESTELRLTGPLGTKGVARISKAGRRMSSFSARHIRGAGIDAETIEDARTVLVRYPTHPEGVLITAKWQT